MHKLTELEIQMEKSPVAGDRTPWDPPAKNKITNEGLLIEFHKSAEMGQITDEFVRLLSIMVERKGHSRIRSVRGRHHQNWDDMRVNAMRHLVEREMCMSFNPELSDNPFGYYMAIIGNSFAQTLNQLKKLRWLEQGYPDRTMIALYDHAMKVL